MPQEELVIHILVAPLSALHRRPVCVGHVTETPVRESVELTKHLIRPRANWLCVEQPAPIELGEGAEKVRREDEELKRTQLPAGEDRCR